MLQVRPASGDSRFYSPNRDLAWCFPSLLKAAFNSMGSEDWYREPWWADYLRYHNVNEEELGQVAIAMANAIKNFADPEINSPAEALLKSGFFNVHPAAQLAVCAKIGQICIGAYYTCMRDVLNKDDGPPASLKDIEKGAAAVEEAIRLKKG